MTALAPPFTPAATRPAPAPRRNPAGHAALARNDAGYRWLADTLGRMVDVRRRPAAALECVRAVADFASFNHAGRFADGAVENLAFAVGRRLPGRLAPAAKPAAVARSDRRRQVVHVVTLIERVGGGTTALRRWIDADRGSRHTVIATHQDDHPIHRGVAEAVARNGGTVLRPDTRATLADRSAYVRRAVRDAAADVCFLHHYSQDPVPTAALALPGGPPVAVVNDADHMFWLGSSVADAVLNWRTLGATLGERRRFVSRHLVLPLPLDDAPPVSRRDARQRLGIPDDQVVLLSVGRGAKYRPDGTRNFFRAADRLLDRHRDAHLYLVGPSAADLAPHLPAGGLGERFHPAGPVPDPSLWQRAADVYLESVPFGSTTALLEAAIGGVPCVPAYDPPCRFLVTDDDPVNDLLTSPRNEDEYLDRASVLIRDAGARRALGTLFRERLVAAHTGPGWLARLHDVYAVLGAVEHDPQPIPVTACEADDVDTALARWCAEIGARPSQGLSAADRDTDTPARVALATAHGLRERSCYREAAGLLWQALPSPGGTGRGRETFAAIAKLPIHWARRHVAAMRARAGGTK